MSDENNQQATPAPTNQATNTAPATDATATPPADAKEPAWLKPRLNQAVQSGVNSGREALLKELGFANADEAKATVGAARAAAEAQLTEQERTANRIKELEPLATEATGLKATVRAYADRELAGLSDLQRAAVTSLAGDDPQRVLATIESLRPTWGAQSEAAQLPTATPTSPQALAPKGASTSAAPAPPSGADGQQQVDHKAVYQGLVKSNPFEAARYFEQHGRSITS